MTIYLVFAKFSGKASVCNFPTSM